MFNDVSTTPSTASQSAGVRPFGAGLPCVATNVSANTAASTAASTAANTAARVCARTWLCIAACALGFSVSSQAVSAAAVAPPGPKSVAVTAVVEHPALDAVRDGVREGLKRAGYEEGKNLRWQYQSAQGNTATASQIARKYVGDRPDAIVAIATPSAQAVVAATKDVPVVYSAVTDPVAAQLVKTMDASGTNVTGVADALALEKQIELIAKIVPNAKRVGIVYNPGEANSAVVVKALQNLLPKAGMTLVEASAPRTVDVASAARSLIGKVDVFYSNTDNNVTSAYEALGKVALDAKIPLIASDTEAIKRGAAAALGVNYRDLGIQTGTIVARIFKGEAPGSIPSQTSDKVELHLNRGVAEKQGVVFSDALIKSAAHVIQ